MFHLFGIVLFIFLFALFIGVASVLFIVRGIFKAGRKMSGKEFTSGNVSGGTYESSSSSSSAGRRASKRKKIFAEDEGEYVEFEEIKD